MNQPEADILQDRLTVAVRGTTIADPDQPTILLVMYHDPDPILIGRTATTAHHGRPLTIQGSHKRNKDDHTVRIAMGPEVQVIIVTADLLPDQEAIALHPDHLIIDTTLAVAPAAEAEVIQEVEAVVDLVQLAVLPADLVQEVEVIQEEDVTNPT